MSSVESVRRKEFEVLHLIGTPKQLVAYQAGTLPEEDLLRLARQELFRPFNIITRWRKIDGWEVRHSATCRFRLGRGTGVTFETCELDDDSLNLYARSTIETVERIAHEARMHKWLEASSDVVVEPVTHWATCSECKAEVSRSSVRVSIRWAGRTLTREYAL